MKPKLIDRYFPAKIKSLRPGVRTTFDIHLYFSMSDHIMLWIKSGEVIEQALINKYSNRGVKSVWIDETEKESFLGYLKEQKITEEEAGLKRPEDHHPKPSPMTNAGAFIREVMESNEIDELQKQALISVAATDVIEELSDTDDLDEQADLNEKARTVVENVLAATSSEAQGLLNQIWKLANFHPKLTHAINVSSYSALFAMAFGRIDQDLITDLALAGILHEVGISQIPQSLASRPMIQLEGSEFMEYANHVDIGVKMVRKFAPEIHQRVTEIIAQHHERFDGSGFPKKLEGFDFDDIAQLVAMADYIESLSSGLYDGKKRTLKQAFQVIDEIETDDKFPKYFNPEVFAFVVDWVTRAESQEAAHEAAQVVGNQVRTLLEDDDVGEKKAS